MMLIVAIAIMKIYKPSLMPKIKGVQEHAIKETDKELIKLIFDEKFTSTMLFTFLVLILETIQKTYTHQSLF